MTCAKRNVECIIQTKERAIWASNSCENPQATCPRLPGEDYTKCRTICRQVGGHAEIQAIARAAAESIDIRGATATVYGHYWMCEPCGRALREAGVTHVTVELAK
jgi:deoxycytidylate deaminase